MLLKYHRWFVLGFGLMWQDWSRVSCSVRSSLEFSWAWGVEWDFSHTWSTRLSLSCLGVNLGPEMAEPWSVHRNQSGLVWTQVLVFFSLTGICTSELWHGAGVPGSWPFPLLIHGCFINFQLVTGEPQGVFAENLWEVWAWWETTAAPHALSCVHECAEAEPLGRRSFPCPGSGLSCGFLDLAMLVDVLTLKNTHQCNKRTFQDVQWSGLPCLDQDCFYWYGSVRNALNKCQG